MYYHAQLIFVLLVEMGFHHGGQAGLKLLTSGDPSSSASQSAGITGVSHLTWPCVTIFLIQIHQFGALLSLVYIKLNYNTQIPLVFRVLFFIFIYLFI